MKNLQYVLLLLFISCSSPKIVYDYDTQEDLTMYKTFQFFADAGKNVSEFNVKRIEDAITTSLLKQGFQISDSPHFFINYKVNTREHLDNNNVGVGIGGGNGGFGVGISTGISIGGKKVNEQLTIDFVSAKKDELFWQSISESAIKENLKPDKKALHYQELIAKMLSKFPPKK